MLRVDRIGINYLWMKIVYREDSKVMLEVCVMRVC